MSELVDVIFNEEITQKGLNDLKAKYPTDLVVDMSDDDEFKRGRKVRTERNKLVDAINRKRLDVNAAIKEKGDQLISEVNDIYEPIVSAFESEDLKKKAEAKRLKEEHEKLMQEERQRINSMTSIVSSCRGKESSVIDDAIESIDLIETDEFHKDVIHQAIETKKQCLADLTQMRADTIAREKLAEERAELEALRAKLESQQVANEPVPETKQEAPVMDKQQPREVATRKVQKKPVVMTYEPLALWPSDMDRAENETLDEICNQLAEAEDYIEYLKSNIHGVAA